MNRKSFRQWLRMTAALIMLICCAAGAAYAGEYVKTSSIIEDSVLKVGDPINAATGEYYFFKELMNLGGMPPLTFRLYYGSFATFYGGDMPIRFCHNLNESATLVYNSITGLQAMEVTFDMKKISFDKSGTEWVLATGNSVPYKFVETSSYYYLFDPEKELLRIFGKSGSSTRRLADRNGNTLTYQRDYANSSAELSDGLGRRLKIRYARFTYTVGSDSFSPEYPLIIEDQNGRRWTFEYALDANEKIEAYDSPYFLRSLKDPMGNYTRFNYGGSKHMTSQVMPRGNIPYVNQYDASGGGNVIYQTDVYHNTTYLSKDVFSGGLSQFTTTNPDGTKQVFVHENNVMKSMTDAAGKTSSFQTDTANRRVTRVTDRMGGTTSYTYHAESGKIASVTNAEGRTVTYTYTPLNYVFKNPENNEQVTFASYKLSRIDYPDGRNEQFSYDAKGNMISRTDRAGKVWSYTYNSRGLMLTAKNPAGGIITNTYNADGTLASSEDSETGTTVYAYDDYKRLKSITDPDGKSVQMSYNLNDQIISITDQNNHTYSYTYDYSGNLSKVTDPAGRETQYGYDLMERLNKITDRLGKISEFYYDTMNRPQLSIDPNRLETLNEYDSRGRKIKVSSAGSVRITGYDDEGVVTTTKTHIGNTTSYQTDKLGNVAKITDPLGNATTLIRDSMNRVTAVKDPLGRTVNYAYDAEGQLSAVSLPLVGTAFYTRNDIGLVTEITDLIGSKWNFAYSVMGRQTSLTDPLTRKWQYAYDTSGRMNQITYPDSSIQTLSFDNAGNITRRSYSANPDLQFGYDALDQLISADNIAFTRDAEGQITDTADSGISFGASYDDGGRLKTVTCNNGAFTVTYGYDATTGLLTSVADSLSNTNISFAYDTDRRLTGITRPNSVNSTFSYDNAGRLTRIREGAIIDIGYTLDAAGQVTDADMAVVPLDPYDALTAGIENYTYNAASQVSTAGYVYDVQGRMTAMPGSALTWDGASFLTKIGNVNLSYNGLGDLLTRNDGTTAIRYFYNYAIGLSPIMAEKNESGGFLRYYVWTPGGQLLYMIDATNGNKVYHFHFDRTGSTLALTDSAGAITDKYAYDPYGRMLRHDGANPQPFAFVGRYGVRQEGNLYHMRARYYDPTTGHFISREPLFPQMGNPKELNPYQYAVNDPIRMVDVTGNEPWYMYLCGWCLWFERMAEWDELNAEWDELNAKWDKENAKWAELNAKWDKENAKWDKYRAERDAAERARIARAESEAKQREDEAKAIKAMREADRAEAELKAKMRGPLYYYNQQVEELRDREQAMLADLQGMPLEIKYHLLSGSKAESELAKKILNDEERFWWAAAKGLLGGKRATMKKVPIPH